MDINKMCADFETELVELCNKYAMPLCIKRMALEKVVLLIKQAEVENTGKDGEE